MANDHGMNERYAKAYEADYKLQNMKDRPILSILIATVPERGSKYRRLIADLEKQAQGLPVEILTDDRLKGVVSVGAKRQSLLERACGLYVCFHDDDDWHSEDYVSSLVEAAGKAPDCIGFEVEVVGMGRSGQGHGSHKLASCSNEWAEWGENVGGYDYVRTIYHKTPVRREHALAIGFKDMRFAEDHDYSKRLKESGLLRTSVFIPRPLYIYRFKKEPFKRKYGIK